MMKLRFWFVSFIFICAASIVSAQQFTFSGMVKDAATGAPLVGASVAVENSAIGTFTDGKGAYSLKVNAGKYKVVYSFLGYKDAAFEVSINGNQTKTVRLQPSAVKIDNVVITAVAKDRNVTSTEMGTQTLTMKEVKLVPVLFGENDVIKTIQLMPAVKSAGEGGTGYYVRGGGADQNLILLDDAPIFNASHMMGMFSVFNGDAIEEAKLYSGSMSAEYGGRLSSVLDVEMREGDKEAFHGQGGIGTISSRFEIEGPLQRNKSSFLIAGRRTYADVFLKLSGKESLKKTKLHFYDVNYKLTDLINEKNKLTLSGYIGRDVFQFREMFGLEGGNVTATASWIHSFSEKFNLSSSLIFSRFDSYTALQMAALDAKLKTGITDVNWKEDFKYRWNKNTLKFGGNVTFHRFSPGTLTTSMLEKPITLEKLSAIDANVYADNSHDLSDYVKLQYGLRFSNFIGIGPCTYYDYDSDHHRTDSTKFGRGEVTCYYPNLEPRASVNVRLNETSSVKAAYTRTCQFMHLIQGSTATLPTDYWTPSTKRIKPQTCSQFSLGYFKNFKENMFETSAEVYYKDMQHQIDYENGANLFLNANLEAYLLYGKSHSYGIELFARKNVGKFTGWVSYTLSKTEKKFQGINSGNWYPVRYDRRHDASIVLMYNFSDRWNVSATWVYSTGDAVSFPSGKYQIDGETISYYTERNGYRMPAYHRMDVGATYVASKSERFESILSVSIYNVYNRKNAYMIFFEPVDEENPEILQAVKVTLFPIIPSISWEFKF